MLNKKDPLIDAIQQVMHSNQADRDAVKAVNEKFGIQDRRVLPRERQGEWDAAYKTVLSEGVEALDEKSFAALAPPYDKATHKDKLVGAGVLEKHPTEPGKHVLAKEEKKMKGDDPCWKNYKMVGMKKKGGKPVPNCVPVSEEGDPSKAIRGDTVTGGSSVTPVSKPKPTSVTPEQQSALTNKINSIKEAKKAAMCEDTLEEKAPPGREDQVKALKKKFPKGSGSPFAIAWSSKKKMDEAMAPSISRADAVTQGRQKQQANAVSSSVQKQNAIQRTNVGSGALTGGSLGNNSGSGTTAVSGPASRLSRVSSSSVAGDARGGARPGPLPPKSPMSGQGSASPPPKSPMSGQGSASPPPKSPMSGQGAPGVRSQPGGARPGVVAKNSMTRRGMGYTPASGSPASGSEARTGGNPTAKPAEKPTAKAPVPKPKPAGGAVAKVVKPVRKQPTTGTVKPTSGGVSAKSKMTALQKQMKRSRTGREALAGPGNS